MTPHFETVTIVGVGLLGGSLGLAMKERSMAGTIRGVGHRASSLESARAVGAIDESFMDAVLASEGADLIVVCTPARLVPPILDSILPVLGPKTVVTDVASTKADICEHAARTWPAPLRFVGSHPMAGSEKYGPEHSTSTLYNGCVTIVDTNPHDPDAEALVSELWAAVGAKVLPMDPKVHDALVARTSHIPHIVAACVAELAVAAGDVTPLVATGFRDVTRVAGGRPELWRDICLTNRDAIAEGLAALSAQLEDVRQMVLQDSADGLQEFFRSAQVARSRALGEP